MLQAREIGVESPLRIEQEPILDLEAVRGFPTHAVHGRDGLGWLRIAQVKRSDGAVLSGPDARDFRGAQKAFAQQCAVACIPKPLTAA
jgi:hypothetical protein